jgi:hypothetical protein
VPLDVDSEKKGTESTDDEQKTVKDIDAAMQEASLINLDELEVFFYNFHFYDSLYFEYGL